LIVKPNKVTNVDIILSEKFIFFNLVLVIRFSYIIYQFYT